MVFHCAHFLWSLFWCLPAWSWSFVQIISSFPLCCWPFVNTWPGEETKGSTPSGTNAKSHFRVDLSHRAVGLAGQSADQLLFFPHTATSELAASWNNLGLRISLQWRLDPLKRLQNLHCSIAKFRSSKLPTIVHILVMWDTDQRNDAWTSFRFWHKMHEWSTVQADCMADKCVVTNACTHIGTTSQMPWYNNSSDATLFPSSWFAHRLVDGNPTWSSMKRNTEDEESSQKKAKTDGEKDLHCQTKALHNKA